MSTHGIIHCLFTSTCDLADLCQMYDSIAHRSTIFCAFYTIGWASGMKENLLHELQRFTFCVTRPW